MRVTYVYLVCVCVLCVVLVCDVCGQCVIGVALCVMFVVRVRSEWSVRSVCVRCSVFGGRVTWVFSLSGLLRGCVCVSCACMH